MIDIKERLRNMQLTVCKEAADHIEQQEAEIARLRKDAEVTLRVHDDSQEWAKLDGSVAWHLIDRHAHGWGEVGDMMEAWGKARFGSSDTPTQSTHQQNVSINGENIDTLKPGV